MVAHQLHSLHVWDVQVVLSLVLDTNHESAGGAGGIHHWQVLLHLVEWRLGLRHEAWLHGRDELAVKLAGVSGIIGLGVLNILDLGKTMVVWSLLGSVAAWVAGLLLHQLNVIVLLVGDVALSWMVGEAVRLLLVSLLSQVDILRCQVGIGHIMVRLRILLD